MDSSTTFVNLDSRSINCHYYSHTPCFPCNLNLLSYFYTSLNPMPNAQVCVYVTVHNTKLQLQTTLILCGTRFSKESV